MVELYINGQRVDTQKTECLFSFGVNRLGDIASRTGTRSNQFTVPATANNIRIFGFADNPNSLSNVPYIQLDFEIRSYGTFVLKGVARLVKYTRAGFELQCYSDNAEWASILKGVKLSDIDFSAASHIRSQTTVTGNRLNTWQDGFIYPNAEFGSLQNNFTGDNTLQWYMFYPAYFLKYIINQILTGIGYTPTGEAWNDPEFDRIVMFPKKETVLNNGLTFITDYAANVETAGSITHTTQPIGGTPIYTKSPYTVEISDPNNQFDVTTYEFTAAYPMEVDIMANLVMDPAYQSTTIGALGIRINGVIQIFYPFGQLAGGNSASIRTVLSLAAGDILDGVVSFQSNIDATITYTSTLFISPLATYIDGQIIKMDKSFDEYDCSDFVRYWFNLKGIMFTTNNATKEINFFFSRTIGENINTAQDITGIVDFTEDAALEYDLNGYAQNTIFKHYLDDADNDIKIRNYDASAALDVQNFNLPAEKTAFESKSAALIRKTVMNGTRTLASIPYDNNTNNIVSKSGVLILGITDRLNINGDYPPNQYSVFFSTIDFNFLLPEYYDFIQSIILTGKKITVYTKANFFQCSSIDVTRPLYINGMGLFFLSEIVDVSLSEETKPIFTLFKM